MQSIPAREEKSVSEKVKAMKVNADFVKALKAIPNQSKNVFKIIKEIERER